MREVKLIAWWRIGSNIKNGKALSSNAIKNSLLSKGIMVMICQFTWSNLLPTKMLLTCLFMSTSTEGLVTQEILLMISVSWVDWQLKIRSFALVSDIDLDQRISTLQASMMLKPLSTTLSKMPRSTGVIQIDLLWVVPLPDLGSLVEQTFFFQERVDLTKLSSWFSQAQCLVGRQFTAILLKTSCWNGNSLFGFVFSTLANTKCIQMI